jgi:hypothetical protein
MQNSSECLLKTEGISVEHNEEAERLTEPFYPANDDSYEEEEAAEQTY